MMPTCPRCGSDNTVRVICGGLTVETSQMIHEGRAVEMDCTSCGPSRNALCRDCEHMFDHEWGSPYP